ncbi:hypothetical protein, partial [Streptococcus suis]
IIEEKQLSSDLSDVIQALYKFVVFKIKGYNLRELARNLENFSKEEHHSTLIINLLNAKRGIFEDVFDSSLAEYSFNFHYGILGTIAPRNQLLIELSKTLWMSGIGEFRSLWWDGSRGFTIGKQTGFYGDRRKYLSKYTDEIVEIHYDV